MFDRNAAAAEMLEDAETLLPEGFGDFLTRASNWLAVAVRKHSCRRSNIASKNPENYVWLLVEPETKLHELNKKYFDRIGIATAGNENAKIPFALIASDSSKLSPDMPISQIAGKKRILVLQATLVSETMRNLNETTLSKPIKQEAGATSTMDAKEGLKSKAVVSEEQFTSNLTERRASAGDTFENAPTSPVPDDLLEKSAFKEEEKHKDLAATTKMHAYSMCTTDNVLGTLSVQCGVSRLEAGVFAGVEILSKIQAELSITEGASNWLTQIESLRADSVRPSTIIGIVGSTGAGKSSIINAMLGEEQLIPTNCMRACTAVVTEISYNFSNDPNAAYSAKIEFIKPDDWRRELEILFSTVFDESGQVTREAFIEDSEANIAYAKIRAVYNKYTIEMLHNTSIDRLMTDRRVNDALGSTLLICEKDQTAFSRRLQQYIDSSEKHTGQPKLNANGNPIKYRRRRFGYWPLVKVVKIQTKADVLSTGAIIVDLPGLQDSNAARAAVAEGYMMNCTGLWIVAPITRAVDDKAAKSLLGKTFKRQLQFDNAYSAVTFICSKADDISVTEAERSLQLDDTVSRLNKATAELRLSKDRLSQQLKLLDQKLESCNDAIEHLEDEIEDWEASLAASSSDQSKQDDSRLDPNSDHDRPRKRARLDADETDELAITGLENEQSPRRSQHEQSIHQVVEVVIPVMTTETRLKNERETQRSLRKERDQIRKELSTCAKQEAEFKSERTLHCIRARNEYVRKAIQQDFANGIRELDMDEHEEDDGDNFDPADDIRNYDLLAQQLPVFCVSSRGYQQLCGKLQSDASVAGFRGVNETEIPQLNHHCKDLTIETRRVSCRKFLVSLHQLLDSMKLWASGKNDYGMTSSKYDEGRTFLSENIIQLESELREAIASAVRKTINAVESTLTVKFGSAAKRAESVAVPTCMSWGAPCSKGGLTFPTYKTVTRRHGVFHSPSAGKQDFNQALAEPILGSLASSWEKSFRDLLPGTISEFASSIKPILRDFQLKVEERCQERKYGLDRIAIMQSHARSYPVALDAISFAAQQMLAEGQKAINRGFAPAVASSMEPAYEACTNEFGKGQYGRMKLIMAEHVKREARRMFRTAADEVQAHLKQLCDAIETMMLEKASILLASLRRDYMSLLGVEPTDSTSSSASMTAARIAVQAILTASEGVFKDVLHGKLDDIIGRYKNADHAGYIHGEEDYDYQSDYDDNQFEDEEIDEMNTDGMVDYKGLSSQE